ncbi:MAG: succinylglutamate desuccinylase/aspartoacylase family protein [Bacteroidota bacterium]
MSESLIIDGHSIAPGEQKTLGLQVAKLPSGTIINIEVHVFRSLNPGPTLLVLAGVHGDEINGIEIVRQSIHQQVFQDLHRGNVIAIPVLNVYGFINFSREVPDGKDVNRSFPGTQRGSLASRVAWILSNKILPVIDVGLDFHTGGSSRFNYPQIRYSADDPNALELARAFAAPYTIVSKPISKSLRQTALKSGKTILVYEAGEALRLDGYAISEGMNGLKRVLLHHGMIPNAPKAEPGLFFDKKTWQRAAHSGMFIWQKSSGTFVKKGEILGYIHETNGIVHYPVKAKIDGYIIGHNNAPVVNLGDPLFHLSPAPMSIGEG